MHIWDTRIKDPVVDNPNMDIYVNIRTAFASETALIMYREHIREDIDINVRFNIDLFDMRNMDTYQLLSTNDVDDDKLNCLIAFCATAEKNELN